MRPFASHFDDLTQEASPPDRRLAHSHPLEDLPLARTAPTPKPADKTAASARKTPPTARKPVAAGKKAVATAQKTAKAAPKAKRPDPKLKQRAAFIVQALAHEYPDATCELDFRTPFELLCATILSAQSTDKMVNTVTPTLFARYPDPAALAQADQAELETIIHSTGFFRNKAKSLIGMARKLVSDFGGEVPQSMEQILTLPGVARKTGNVVLGTAYGMATGITVDTHVARLSQRLGLTKEEDPPRIEQDLMALIPSSEWVDFGHRLIWHGRRVCHARKPWCDQCTLAEVCPSRRTDA